jgi:diaminohydroxyphosphoribosylaminopyrimidine deaminase/5-amino-6-(5-phosphoribosylamino)uracil reductase
MKDPNPLVAGEGMKRLQAAGIQTESGLMQDQAEQINPGFIKRMAQGLPWVRIKMAMSLDGRTAMASGESQWITGVAARRDVQFLRARSEAILTGIGTVLADDPSMNLRLAANELGIDDPVLQPLRVVLDSQLQMSPNAKMLKLEGRTLIVACGAEPEKKDQLEQAGAEVLVLPGDNHRVDLKALMKELALREVNEIHVETGAELCGALLAQNLVDELVIYMAGHLMGDEGKGLFKLPGLESMADRRPIRITDIRAVGEDWRITAYPVNQESD